MNFEPTPKRIFPFCPGAIWSVDKDQFISPELSRKNFDEVISGKDLIISCFGGLIEIIGSMFILEHFNRNLPNKLYWNGDPKGHSALVRYQGIAPLVESECLDHQTLRKYPLPFFQAESGQVIFNALNNYLASYSWNYLNYKKNSQTPWEQIGVNASIPIDYSVDIPVLRSLPQSGELITWMVSNKFNPKIPFVLVVPETQNISIHNKINYNWRPSELRALAAILKQKNINTLILSDNYKAFIDQNCFVCPFKMETLYYMTSKASAVMAKDIDIMFLANAISDAKLIGLSQKGIFNISETNKLMKKKNKILTKSSLSATEVADFILKD